ncbi:lasso peptide biosynthesis B2 protein [Emticicia aquatica]|nr:lasso peptide biosynthesis B2 protein [Emticicia aquatica]
MQRLEKILMLSFRRKLLIIMVLCLSFGTFIMMKYLKKNTKFGQRNGVLKNTTIDIFLLNDIRFAIEAVNKIVPWENVCRHQAFQAMLLCKLYKIPYQIFVGFKKNNDGKIEGHAWTVVDNQIITGFCDTNEYIVQSVFS